MLYVASSIVAPSRPRLWSLNGNAVGGALASLLAFILASYSHSLSVHYDIYCMAILQSDWSRGCYYTRIIVNG